jgi:hypothetical protein
MVSSDHGPSTARPYLPMSRFSSTESDGNSFLPSGVMAMPRAMTSGAASAPIGSPSKTICDASFFSTPEIERISVVLPAPLAPTMAIVSPASSAISTPNSAWKSP